MIDDPFQYFNNSQRDIRESSCDFLIITQDYEVRNPRVSGEIQQRIKDTFYNPVSEHFISDNDNPPVVRNYDPSSS